MSTHMYPVRVDATLQPRLSRWLWLVKWLLAIPHFVVLFFLWIAFAALSVIAIVAILFTGRYPRTIFDFNVGVLRWTWRVSYYAYGGLATDEYPPFSLDERPDYPAHLEIDYPDHLSRGLALVKWWLLAIPHYLLVGVFLGGGWYAASGRRGSAGIGLIDLLVFLAAIALLFTGSYPRSIFDLVLGLNRWVLRVAAYVGLMTDEYPPFRLDQGGTDPGTARLMGDGQVAAYVAPPDPATAPPPPTTTVENRAARPPTPTRWGAGRVVAVIAGAVCAVASLGALAAGAGALVADTSLRDHGYLMTPTANVDAPGHAVVSQSVEFRGAAADIPARWLGTVKVEATSNGAGGVFVGIAPTAAVNAYLGGVAHSVVANRDNGLGRHVRLDNVAGGSPTAAPATLTFWTAKAAGTGTQTLTWAAERGDWTLVVMQPSGAAPVNADVKIGATIPALDNVGVILLVAGVLLAGAATLLLVVALRRRDTA